jgi:hypothetical protein
MKEPVMRKYLAILSAVAVLGIASHAQALTIDTSSVARTGHRGFAAELRPLLASELQKALGPRFRGAGTVRITRIYLAPYGGGEANGGEIEDKIYGVVIVPGRGAIPIMVTLPPSTGGAWYAPNVDERRVYRLVEAFAGWVARSI